MKIQLPNNWRCRPYQDRAYNYLVHGGKRLVGVDHRRWGKDKMLLNATAVLAHKRVGVHWHLLPEAAQARKAIWEAVDEFTGIRLIDQAFPPPIRETTRESDMFIRFKIGSTWQVVGSDNYDSLIGSPPIGVVFSEFAYANPAAWQKISPILLNNGGWAAFISTPCGRNHFHGIYEYARSAEGQAAGWYAELQTVEDSLALVYARIAGMAAQKKEFRWRGKVIGKITDLTPQECLEMTREIITQEERQLASQRGAQEAQALIQQEYYCSFQAAIPGAYYGHVIEEMENTGKVTRVPYDPGFLVETWWDLGIRDDTAIWFVQHVGRERRIIDYYESAGVGIDHYVKVLRDKPYQYADAVLPHDAGHGQLSQRGGMSLADVLKRDYRIANRIVAPTKSLQLSIQRVRTFLPTCVFDAERTKDGREKLLQYRRVWNAQTRAYNDQPLHDFTSHAADAFRTGVDGLLAPIAGQGVRGVKSDWDRLAEGARMRYAVGHDDDVLGRH